MGKKCEQYTVGEGGQGSPGKSTSIIGVEGIYSFGKAADLTCMALNKGMEHLKDRDVNWRNSDNVGS